MLMAEKPKNPNFEPLHSIGLRPRSGQSPKFIVGNNGTLLIRKIVLIMAQCKNLSLESITFCTSARELTKNKKCAPYVRAKHGLSYLFKSLNGPNDFILEIESSKCVQKLCKTRKFSKIRFLRYGLVGGRYI